MHYVIRKTEEAVTTLSVIDGTRSRRPNLRLILVPKVERPALTAASFKIEGVCSITSGPNVYTQTRKYDGDGQVVGYVQTHTVNGTMAAGWPKTVYHLRSTVLGGRAISNYDGQGGWIDTQVYAGTERIGSLGKTVNGASPYNTFRYADPLTGDEVTTSAGGTGGQSTLDTNGVAVPLADPFPPAGEEGDGSCVIWDDSFEGHNKWAATVIPIEGSAGCVLDGLPMECRFISGESSVACPNNDCGTHSMTVAQNRGGRVASSTFLVSPGEPGWAGSLDGTYRDDPRATDWFNFNNPSDAREFLQDGELLPFLSVSGGVGSPENSGFLYGRFGFNQDELNRLATAYERINRENCHKFFNNTLANLRKGEGTAPQSGFTPSTLQGVLNITTLNKYSPALTARQVGVSQSSWANVQYKFATPEGSKIASGVTLTDGRVFLGDNAFHISGPIESFFGGNSADLSGIIIHEFFHRAGLNEGHIQALHPQIQQNCGIPGFGL